MFADPAFDGDPVQIYEPKAGEPIELPQPGDESHDGLPGGTNLPPNTGGPGEGGGEAEPRKFHRRPLRTWPSYWSIGWTTCRN